VAVRSADWEGNPVAIDMDMEKVLSDLGEGGGPVMEALTRMNADALQQDEIDPRTALLTRFAALVALDAAPPSYLVHLALADEAGLRAETLRALLIELAPVVGSARIVSAAGKVQQAIRLAHS
jgi:4-carboxymuconolactone decarboxylase